MTYCKRGRYWAILVTGRDGERSEMSTGLSSREEAEKWAKDNSIEEMERMAKLGILTQRVVASLLVGKQIALGETFDEWRTYLESRSRSTGTIDKYLQGIGIFGRGTGTMETALLKITPEQIHAWVNRHGPQKFNLRNFQLKVIRSFFTFAMEKGWVLRNPAKFVTVDRSKLLHNQNEVHKSPVFTDDEICRLVEVTKPGGVYPNHFFHHAVQIAATTGLRMIDIANLQWRSFDLEGYLVVWTQKNDKRVMVPVSEELKRAWLTTIPRHHEIWVFPYPHWNYGSERNAVLFQKFEGICRKARIRGKTFHGLRATYITNKARAGMPIAEIATLAGHSQTSTTEGYIRA